MTPPDDRPPKWLERGYSHDSDGLYELTDDADSIACVTVPGVESNVRRTLAEWSEWRAEMAKLLGLVEPPEDGKWQVVADVFVARTTAAELRTWATAAEDWDTANKPWDDGELARMLRARADELDPP